MNVTSSPITSTIRSQYGEGFIRSLSSNSGKASATEHVDAGRQGVREHREAAGDLACRKAFGPGLHVQPLDGKPPLAAKAESRLTASICSISPEHWSYGEAQVRHGPGAVAVGRDERQVVGGVRCSPLGSA